MHETQAEEQMKMDYGMKNQAIVPSLFVRRRQGRWANFQLSSTGNHFPVLQVIKNLSRYLGLFSVQLYGLELKEQLLLGVLPHGGSDLFPIWTWDFILLLFTLHHP